MTSLSDGGFVVTWESFGQDRSGNGVYGQRLQRARRQRQGSEFQINTTTASTQQAPSVTSLADGGFVVTWESSGQDGSSWGIYGQRYNAQGVAQGSEFQINTTTASTQQAPSVTSLADGGFVVTWESFGQDGDSNGVYGQRYNAQGVAQGSEFQINSETTGNQAKPLCDCPRRWRFRRHMGVCRTGRVWQWASTDSALVFQPRIRP